MTTIEMHLRPSLMAAHAAWNLYETAFADINALAAQRHLMTVDELLTMWHDDRIEKWLALGAGGLLGLGVQTSDLDAWPLISPAYFERKWPKLYADQHIWYVGFVCTRQDPKPSPHVFAELIRAMSAGVRAAGGISVMDYCTANVMRGLPRSALGILTRLDEDVRMSTIDQQSFVAYDFTEGNR